MGHPVKCRVLRYYLEYPSKKNTKLELTKGEPCTKTIAPYTNNIRLEKRKSRVFEVHCIKYITSTPLLEYLRCTDQVSVVPGVKARSGVKRSRSKSKVKPGKLKRMKLKARSAREREF